MVVIHHHDSNHTMRYDVLFIDSDETIVDFKKCQRRAFHALCDERLSGTCAEPLYERYQAVNEHMWRRHHRGEISKDELRFLRMRETFAEFEVDIPSCVAKYEERLASEAHFMPHAVSVLNRLKDACTLVVVTNGLGHVHRYRFAHGGLTNLFAGIVVSGDKESPNYRKPFEDIFRDAHERFAASVSKNRILMVGDSEDTDVQGGNGYGVATCRYVPGYRNESPTSTATHIMHDWRQLPAIVDMEC
jgi:FMN phosphatase YigB (HAD superfamily)